MTSPFPPGVGEHHPARIKDVAAAAGVSFKTVSNVVHGRPNVGVGDQAAGARRDR